MVRKAAGPAALAVLAIGITGCGGGGSPASPSSPPTTTPAPGSTVTVTVFYDENGNGQLDAGEAARVPGVEVVIGSGTGRSAVGTGVAQVTGIQAGTHSVNVRTDSLPWYFQALPPVSVAVPGTSDVRVPLVLEIGRNHPNLYLGMGDSITFGDGSSDGLGYSIKLQNLLGPHFGQAEVRTHGRQGDTSAESVEATKRTLGFHDPAYMLILLGTNDWNDQACQSQPPLSCYTIDSLREIVHDVKGWNTLPVLGTIPPVNPSLAPASRNTWYDEMNVGIKALGQQEQVLVADINAEMKAGGSLPALFADHVHPNDAGYQLIAQAWFKAITRGRAAAAATAGPRFGFSLH